MRSRLVFLTEYRVFTPSGIFSYVMTSCKMHVEERLRVTSRVKADDKLGEFLFAFFFIFKMSLITCRSIHQGLVLV